MNFWKFLDRNIEDIFIATCLLAVLGVLAFLSYLDFKKPEPCHKPASIYQPSEAQFQKWYKDLNRDYFSDQLPKNVELKWGDLTSKGYMGLTEHRPDGSILITVDRTYDVAESTAYLTIAHESCHLKTQGTELDLHGPKFQNCMLQLANKGAFEGVW